jgi:uncharacterized membrane protein
MPMINKEEASAPVPVEKRPRRRSLLSPHHAVGRFAIPASLGLLAYLVCTPQDVEWWMRAVVGWDVFGLAAVTLCWTVILKADSKETERRAGGDDPGRHLVFGVALLASMFSFFAAAFVLRHIRTLPAATQLAWTGLTLAAIVLSWTLAHTVYTLRYAHLFYRRSSHHGGPHGLQFPGDEPPADIDFAYFAFTIGMCFQVSDVVVTSTRCRRAVLLHAVVSFVYNTAILALALNLVFGAMT